MIFLPFHSRKLVVLTSIFIFLLPGFNSFSQVVTSNPAMPNDLNAVVITFDAAQGNLGLKDYTGDVYAHTGVITNLSTSPGDWKYVKSVTWGNNTPETKLTRISANSYQLTISPTLRAYYGVPANEVIQKMAFVFRSGVQVGGKYLEGKTEATGDIFLDVFPAGLNVTLTSPSISNPLVTIGSPVTISVRATNSTAMSVFIDNKLLKNTSSSSFDTTLFTTIFGKHSIKATATDGSKTVIDSSYFYIRGTVPVASLPAGAQPGINYIDKNTVTLVLHDPLAFKTFAFLIGDFNNWELDDNYYMKRTPDGKYYWLTLTNLTPGKEYIYQYYVDGQLRLADPYCEKVSDPWNDKYISASVYPGLITYPYNKTSGIASVFQTNQPAYQWVNAGFQATASEDLVIYELHIRDFVASHDVKTVLDTLNYLQRLGVNAIELMPIMEFEGNDSWGYNPAFMFASDKYYGTKNDYKKFIDECHKRGIAIILDIVLNHAFGSSPMVQMYWDAANSRPSAQNPWFNQVATHPYSVGYDFNHESLFTREYCKRVMKYWMTEYKVDGFRFDMSKGFTQKNSGTDVGFWGQYDQSRVDILKEYRDYMISLNPKFYIILEHFADNSEETLLSNYGMMLWGNLNYNYLQAGMGFSSGSDFSGISYKNRGWGMPGLVGYMESHDEERIMSKILTFGNAVNTAYNVKDTTIALKRAQLDAAFFLTVPGPKMIWQFGELGYDISIDYNGRLGMKPVKWNYQNDFRRKYLYNIYSSLINLRKQYPVFKTTDFNVNFTGVSKRINLNHTSMNVTIIGNFDIAGSAINPQFQHTGKWYDLLRGDSITVSLTTGSINLNPGEYHIYTDVRVKKPDFTTGINNITKSELTLSSSVFPNPANDFVTFLIYDQSGSETSIEVFNLLGQSVKRIFFNKTSGDYSYTWNLEDNNGKKLHAGIYLYKINSGNFERQGKIVIQ